MKKLGQFIFYLAVVAAFKLLRATPRALLKLLAHGAGNLLYLWPEAGKVTRANLRAAFPEKSEKEVRRIARASIFNLLYNIVEFLWMCGNTKRIERCCTIPEPLRSFLADQVKEQRRIIFVNPHLGSWEDSGLMAPHYSGVKMVAIAKPVRNPYLDRFYNRLAREQESGLRIIHTKGAMRACLKALKDGYGVGTLIDQNTRVRDGGTFVDFFGLPVPSSTAPAVLMDYCVKNSIPAIIIYGTSVRLENGVVTAHAALLSKPYGEYASPAEVLQELMHTSEEFIRKFPEQYLWFYKRFQYIPQDAPPELKARYPYYATVASDRFYRR